VYRLRPHAGAGPAAISSDNGPPIAVGLHGRPTVVGPACGHRPKPPNTVALRCQMNA